MKLFCISLLLVDSVLLSTFESDVVITAFKLENFYSLAVPPSMVITLSA